MKLAAVPEWVIARHRPIAIAVYAALDVQDGHGTHADLARLLECSTSAVRAALGQLNTSGAVSKLGPATYSLRREVPLHSTADSSTQSTDLSTPSPQDDGTPDAALRAASGAAADELSTDSVLPTTTRQVFGSSSREGRETLGVQKTPPVRLVEVAGHRRKQNLGFNALADECDADPRSRSGEITAALRQIRGYVWSELRNPQDHEGGSEPFEAHIADCIRTKARLYRDRMNGALLTPTALAKWWFDLDKLQAKGGLSPEQIARGDY